MALQSCHSHILIFWGLLRFYQTDVSQARVGEIVLFDDNIGVQGQKIKNIAPSSSWTGYLAFTEEARVRSP